MNLLARIKNGAAVAAGRAVAVPASRAVARYFNGENSPFFHNWRPALRDSSDDVGQALRVAAARAIDAVQNSGWLSGIVDHSVTATVGNGLRLSARPRYQDLGWTKQEAAEWSRDVERRFHDWASDPWECDASGKFTLDQLVASAFRAWFCFGEITTVLPLIRREGSISLTKVQVVSPHRLKDETRKPDLIQGIFTDPNGVPTAYRFRRSSEYGSDVDLDLRARDRDGRPGVVHCYDGMPGQIRGITPFAPVLKVVRQYDQLADATLTTALLQTIFAATVTTNQTGDDAFAGLFAPADADGMTGYLEKKLEWYEASKIDLSSHGRINHLFPGETLDFHGSKTPNDQYDGFHKGLLREIARCAGTLYEVATGDFHGATYSSVRMGTSTIWPITLYRRKHIPGRMCHQVYDAWLEEDIAKGRTPFPGGLPAFLAQRSAVTRSVWKGPPRPTADDLKTARADDMKLKNGTATLASQAAEEGEDWESRAEQLVAEVEYFEDQGLQHPFMKANAPAEADRKEEQEDGN